MKLSTEDNHYQVSEIVKDPEQEAKEEYMRKLMSFRKDELILPEESEEDENENETAPLKEKDIQGVEDSYELVDSIEDKINKIQPN
jgi:predicted transcriptional regulator